MNKDKIGIILVFLIILFISIKAINKEMDIKKYGVKSEAKIIDYYKIGAKYYIKYVFYVRNIKYIGEKRTGFFKCDNGVEGCKGETFIVTYSKIDPSNNDIDLGKYEFYWFSGIF